MSLTDDIGQALAASDRAVHAGLDAAAPSGVAAPADDTDEHRWVTCDTCRDRPGISPYNPAHDCPAGCDRGLVWDEPDIYRGEP